MSDPETLKSPLLTTPREPFQSFLHPQDSGSPEKPPPSHTQTILERRIEFTEGPSSPLFRLDQITNDINQAGAVIGLLSLFCSYLRPLRPVSAFGIQLLSHPGVALTLLVSGGYSLYRQTPEVWNAAGRLTGTYAPHSPHSQAEDLVMISGYGIGLLGFAVGVNSFALGGRTYFSSLKQLEAEGVPSLLARQISWRKADAVRRAAQDPEIWGQLARGSATLSETERMLLSRFGKFSGHALLEGSAVVGVGQLGVGLEKMSEKSRRGEKVSAKEVLSLLLQTATQVTPGVTVALYRAGRGDRRFNLGPALSQELTESVYRDPKMAGWVLEKLERGIPRLPAQQEKEYIAQGHQDLAQVEKMLEVASALERPLLQRPPSSAPPPGVPQRPKPDSAPPAVPKKEWIDFGVEDFLASYSQGSFQPSSILKLILEHPAVKNGAVFPRPVDRGALARALRRLAAESDRHFENGNPRPLEGIFVAVKDLFPGVDGLMNLDSKTARVKREEKSPVIEALLEMGAIPIPVGMVAAANGGSGQHAGFGYVPHPVREGYDPAGSSSATAYVVGLKDLPINLGIGTDTGGSIIAPAGAVDLFGFVPPRGVISTYNMVPFATFLDRVGVISQNAKDGIMLARTLSRSVGEDPHQVYQNPGMLYQPSSQKPAILYLQDHLAASSAESRANFQRRMNLYRREGFEVIGLDSRWNFLSEVPFLLYPLDAYPAFAFTHTNPLMRNPFEPPRRTLDGNLYLRLPKGGIALRFGLFDKARALSGRFEALVNEKLGDGFVLASSSVEAIPTADIHNGVAVARLDGHDRITMAKNRIDAWGQVNLPTRNWKGKNVGITFSGPLPLLMHFVESKP